MKYLSGKKKLFQIFLLKNLIYSTNPNLKIIATFLHFITIVYISKLEDQKIKPNKTYTLQYSNPTSTSQNNRIHHN
jgi:hypothetical protein